MGSLNYLRKVRRANFSTREYDAPPIPSLSLAEMSLLIFNFIVLFLSFSLVQLVSATQIQHR